MIQVTPSMRILLAVQPTDFRRGIDALARLCREELKSDPMSGTLFVFRNRRGTAIKLLYYDSQGFWIMMKRLSAGHFRWWPEDAGGRVTALQVHQLQLLLWNGNPDQTGVAPPWRKVAVSG